MIKVVLASLMLYLGFLGIKQESKMIRISGVDYQIINRVWLKAKQMNSRHQLDISKINFEIRRKQGSISVFVVYFELKGFAGTPFKNGLPSREEYVVDEKTGRISGPFIWQ